MSETATYTGPMQSCGCFDGEGTVTEMMRRIYALSPAFRRLMRAGRAAGEGVRPSGHREPYAFARLTVRVSDSDRAKIADLWHAGTRDLNELSTKTGFSTVTVARVLDKLGLRRRHGPRSGTSKVRSSILSLSSASKTAAEIADAIGCSESYVKQVLKHPTHTV